MVLDAATYGGICDGLYGVWGEGIGHWLCHNWGMGGLKTRCDLADQVSFIFFLFFYYNDIVLIFFKKKTRPTRSRPGQNPESKSWTEPATEPGLKTIAVRT